MKALPGVLALVVSVAALSVALYRSPAEWPETSSSDERIRALEGEVARLTRVVEDFGGRDPGRLPVDARGPVSAPADAADAPEAADASSVPDARLEALVEKAVAAKAEEVVTELEIKGNKKPHIDVFAKALELTDAQRAAAEREIIRGQRETYRILETPTAEGDNLMSELVELIAKGEAWPGRDHGWGPWIGRVTTIKVPGTDQTYAERVEVVKASVRQAFKRTFSDEQWKEYEDWGADPIEIEDVPGSPNEALGERIRARAQELREQHPDGPPR